VRRSGAGLDRGASRLLADVVIALNMNQQDRYDGVRGGDPVDLFGRAECLPPCMSTEATRERLVNGECVCELHLCPYLPEQARGSRAYRGLGAAFCAHQQRIARGRRPLPWQPKLRGERLTEFWTRILESRSDVL
jgi:hypothetical protein